MTFIANAEISSRTRGFLDLIPVNFNLRDDLKYESTAANNEQYFISLQLNRLGSSGEKIPNICPQVLAPRANFSKHKPDLKSL
jgi:hypothetical protein